MRCDQSTPERKRGAEADWVNLALIDRTKDINHRIRMASGHRTDHFSTKVLGMMNSLNLVKLSAE
jgi:hypothetical protein